MAPAPRLSIGRHPCSCCGFRTLAERGVHEICPVCFWRDDGQDDADADRVRGVVGGWRVLPPAAFVEGFAAVRLDRGTRLLKSDPSEPLRLTPGQHTVRVACRVDTFRPVGNPVEIEIRPAEGS